MMVSADQRWASMIANLPTSRSGGPIAPQIRVQGIRRVGAWGQNSDQKSLDRSTLYRLCKAVQSSLVQWEVLKK